MRLRDLDAHFIGKAKIEEEDVRSYERLPGIEGAQGIMFQCPKCAGTSGHYVICWFATPVNAPRVPDKVNPGPGRWNPQGFSIDDLTFVPPGAVSVQLLGGCNWHGFVKNGDAS